MISERSLLISLLIFATGVVAAIIVFLIGRAAGRRIFKSTTARHSLNLIILGSASVALFGIGLLYSIAYLNSTNPSLFPWYFKPSYLRTLVEIVVLATSVRSFSWAVKKIFPSMSDLKAADRFLIYGIYALAIPILVYILISSPISPTVAATTLALVGFIFGLIATYLVAYVVNLIMQRFLDSVSEKEAGLKTILLFVRRIVVGIIALIGVAISTFAAFPRAGVAVASLFVAAGFASIVIGLAAQSSLANIFAGIIISSSQPFRLNDAVLYSNEWAWVEDIKLTFTILRTWDNRRVIVPNQMFLNSTLINYDLTDSSKLCIVFVNITYESDVDKAITIMKGAAREHPDFLPSGNLPVVHLMDIGDANGSTPDANATPGIYLRLLSRAKDQPTNFQMSKDLLYTIKKEFEKEGIQFAYPKRGIVVEDGSSTFKGK